MRLRRYVPDVWPCLPRAPFAEQFFEANPYRKGRSRSETSTHSE